MKRRTLLARVSALGSVAAAGCVGGGGGGGDNGDGTTTTETTTESTTTTTTATTTEATTESTTTTTTAETTTTTDTTTEPTTTTTPEAGRTIEMRDVAFDPVEASVAPGTTVQWVNEDGFDHDVTSTTFHDAATEWDFVSELGAGESVTYTFENPGIYEYYCSIHGEGSMCGVVLVGDVSLDQSLPCQGGGNEMTTTTTDDDGYY